MLQLDRSGAPSIVLVMQVMAKRLHIIGSTLRARPRDSKVEIVSKFADFALQKFASGQFRPQVGPSQLSLSRLCMFYALNARWTCQHHWKAAHLGSRLSEGQASLVHLT